MTPSEKEIFCRDICFWPNNGCVKPEDNWHNCDSDGCWFIKKYDQEIEEAKREAREECAKWCDSKSEEWHSLGYGKTADTYAFAAQELRALNTPADASKEIAKP